MRDKFGASVGRDVVRDAMLGEHVKDKQFRQLGRSDRIVSRNEHSLFESLSTMTRIAVNPEELGSCSMKSMEIESHGRSGIGSCLR